MMGARMNEESVRKLFDSLCEKSRALAALSVMEVVEPQPPASDADLNRLEAHLGRPAPPTLRALLRCANGAANLLVFFDLLSVDEMLPGSAAYERAAGLAKRFVDGVPLVPEGVLVFADKRGDRPDCVYLDPHRTGPDGEWRVVTFDHEADDDLVDANLVTFLERMNGRFALLLEDASADFELEA